MFCAVGTRVPSPTAAEPFQAFSLGLERSSERFSDGIANARLDAPERMGSPGGWTHGDAASLGVGSRCDVWEYSQRAQAGT